MQGQFEGLDPPSYYVLAARGMKPPSPQVLRDTLHDPYPGIISELELQQLKPLPAADLKQSFLLSATSYLTELLTDVELPIYIPDDQDLYSNSMEARDRFCQVLSEMRYVQAKRNLKAVLEHRIQNKRKLSAMLREQRRRILEGDGELVSTFLDSDLPFHAANIY